MNIGERWEKGIPHDPRSEKLVRAMAKIDFEQGGDALDISIGGDGDNGEHMMYLLDVHFAETGEPTVEELQAEIKKYRDFIVGVKSFDPRTDIYATGLMDECNDILGLCRCCGQEVCDDAE